MCACVFTDRARDLILFVSDHERVKILDRLLEQVAGVQTVGAQYLVLDDSHRPEEEQRECHDMNRHHQQQGSSPGARNASGQPPHGIKTSVARIHPVHSSE